MPPSPTSNTLAIVPHFISLQWRHNGRDSLFKSPASRLFTQPSIQMHIKENIKAPHHWPLCMKFPAQMASNAESVPIWWRHHVWLLPGQRHTSQCPFHNPFPWRQRPTSQLTATYPKRNSPTPPHSYNAHFYGLVQERRNSSASSMELHPSILYLTATYLKD